jgi:hypothetical protein
LCNATVPNLRYGCTLQSISSTGASQGKFQEAVVVYQQVIQQREEVLGVEHRDTLNKYDCLAFILNTTGDYQSAEKHVQWAYEGSQRTLGRDHYAMLGWSINLVNTFFSQRKYV